MVIIKKIKETKDIKIKYNNKNSFEKYFFHYTFISLHIDS